MEKAQEAAASAYEAISSSVQSGLAAAKGLAGQSGSAPLKATFRPLRAPPLPRSSHTVCVVGGRAYIFGGEIAPRQPVDNAMHIVTLPSAELQEADYEAVPAKPSVPGGDVPAPRVGHVAAAIGNAIFVHGGRGGPAMAALDERARVWMFDCRTRAWTALDHAHPAAPAPLDRSFHAATASEHPLPPPAPNTANVLRDDPPDAAGLAIPAPPAQGAHGTLFIHAGCLSDGSRATDLWAFDVAARAWSAFPSAPGPPRGGTSLALVGKRLYRFGGFDGTRELGAAVDWLDVAVATFDDHAGRAEAALAPPASSSWYSDAFARGDGPADRSVAALLPVSTGQGRHWLLVVGGETSPSNRGHDAAGKFLDDVWAFQLKPEGMTASALRDATRGVLMGLETGEARFTQCRYFNEDGVMVQESQTKPMGGRGWFASTPLGDVGGGTGVLVHGGIDESNERIGDGWIITVE